MDIVSLALILLFAGALVWLLRIVLRQKKEIRVYTKFWNFSRIMIFIAAAICFMPFLALDFQILTIGRSLMMASTIILFGLICDGLCDDGFLYMGSKIPFTAVTEYDIKEHSKKCTVILVYKEVSRKGKVTPSQMLFDFPISSKDEVTTRLKNGLGKKYKRMKG